MQSLQGHFLVATPKLLDPNFHKTVVLILQHSSEGSLGVVLNRPLEITLRQACEQLETPCEIDAPLHHGGPCEALLTVVHTASSFADNEILPNLYFTTARDQLEELLERPADEMKFFVGYAGWGAGQLEQELKTNSWVTTLATPERIFNSPTNLWTRLTTELALSKWVDPKRIPTDPRAN